MHMNIQSFRDYNGNIHFNNGRVHYDNGKVHMITAKFDFITESVTIFCENLFYKKFILKSWFYLINYK